MAIAAARGIMRKDEMPSIDDFVAHRWADAKEALRQLAPAFVRDHETTVRLQNINLWSPVYKDPKDPPDKRLSKGWHRLLESCEQLCMQVTPVNVAAEALQSLATLNLSDVEAGKLADYHLRSWFAHMLALVERTQDVIELTTSVYLDKPGEAKHVSKPLKGAVDDRVGKYIARQRNDYLHANRSPTSTVTQDGLWEGLVAVGMTPDIFLRECHYPSEADRVMVRFKGVFLPGSNERIEALVGILFELEQSLAARSDLKYALST